MAIDARRGALHAAFANQTGRIRKPRKEPGHMTTNHKPALAT